MSATETQIDAVITLGDTSDDGTSESEASTFNTAYGEVYQNEPNDPYELAAAKVEKAKIVAATPAPVTP